MSGGEIVKFVSAKPYVNLPFDVDVFYCLQGRKEVVIVCSDELKAELKALPSDSVIGHKLKDIKAYLDSKSISYIEDYTNTTVI